MDGETPVTSNSKSLNTQENGATLNFVMKKMPASKLSLTYTLDADTKDDATAKYLSGLNPAFTLRGSIDNTTLSNPFIGSVNSGVGTYDLWNNSNADILQNGSPAPTATTCPFTDVSAAAYYYNAVLWAVEKGITKGTSATTFSLAKDCSRAQIVTFQYRTARSSATGTVNPFADVTSNAYYARAVLWAVKEGITQGTSATIFSPNADCTRAQIVTFLFRQLCK